MITSFVSKNLFVQKFNNFDLIFFRVKLYRILFVFVCIIHRQMTCKSITIECSREITNYCFISYPSINLPEENTFYIINSNRYWRKIETVLEIRPQNPSYIASLDSVFEQFPDLERLYISNSLNELPSMRAAPHTLQLLSCRNNFIKNITKFAFSGAVNLEQIDLSANLIRLIEDEAFSGHDRLFSIRLDNNKLGSLSKHTFVGANTLSYLSLKNNSITTIADGCFALKSLEELILAHNRLEVISNSIFDGADRLRIVSFAHNRIKVVNLIAIAQSAPIEILSFQDNQLGKYEKQSINCSQDLNQQLRELSLANNKLANTYIFDGLKCFQSLEMLNLNANDFIQFDNISNFRIYFPRLSTVHLIDNKIQCDWLNQTAFDTSFIFTRSIRTKFSIKNIACIP